MKMILGQPEVCFLPQHKMGEVKFFDEKKGFGFLIDDDGEDRFFHGSWTRVPTQGKDGQLLVADLLDERLTLLPGQKVLYLPRFNSIKTTLEAHLVVDAYEAAVVRYELSKLCGKLYACFEQLQYYRLTRIVDINETYADNQAKCFKERKIGESRDLIFQGNNTLLLEKLMSETTNYILEQNVNGTWTPCTEISKPQFIELLAGE